MWSMSGEATVNRQADADHEAGAGTAQPKYCRGDLLCSAEPADRLLLHDFSHNIGLARKHVGDHWRVDCAGTDRIDTDSAWRIFDTGAFGEAQHRVFRAMIGCAAREPNETAQRRAVHDRTSPLLSHDAQFVLHACPDAALVDCGDASKFSSGSSAASLGGT